MKLVRFIGKGACASVYIGCFAPRYYRISGVGRRFRVCVGTSGATHARTAVVKRMRRSKVDVYATYSWRAAGLSSPPQAPAHGCGLVLQYKHVRAVLDAEDSESDASDAEDSDRENTGDVVDTRRKRARASRSDARAVVRLPVAWMVASHNRDGARELWRSGAFVTEAAVSECLQRHVQPHLPARVFCRQRDAWVSHSYAYIAMDWAGQPLEDALPRLSLAEVQAVFLQVLLALAWAQDVVHFKHHDLHTGNVFVQRQRGGVPRGWKAPWGSTYELPETKVSAVIADFGLSAATDPASRVRFSRADYCLMDVDEDEWGDWTNALHEYEAYDAIVFLMSMLDCSGVAAPVRAWLRRVKAAVKELDPHVQVSKGVLRPFSIARGATPRALLSHAVFQPFLRAL